MEYHRHKADTPFLLVSQGQIIFRSCCLVSFSSFVDIVEVDGSSPFNPTIAQTLET